MEGSTTYQNLSLGGGTSNWQLLTDEPHSPTHYWKQTVSGNFNAGAMTGLFGPAIDWRWSPLSICFSGTSIALLATTA